MRKTQSVKKISGFQLFILLLVCRCPALLTGEPFGDNRPSALTTLAAAAASAAVFLFVLYIVDKASRGAEKKLSTMPSVSAFVAAFLLFSASVSLSFFTRFIAYASELNSLSAAALTLLLTAAAVYIACKGSEGIARAVFLLSILLAATFLFVLLANSPNYSAERLASDGLALDSDFAREFARLTLCPELLLFAALKEKLRAKERGNKALAFFFAAQAFLFVIVAFASEAVFGEMEELLPYPLLSLTSVAQFTVIRRLDAVLTGILAAVSAFRAAAFILASLVLLKRSSLSVAPAMGLGIALYFIALSFGQDIEFKLAGVLLALGFTTALAAVILSQIMSANSKSKEGETE